MDAIYLLGLHPCFRESPTEVFGHSIMFFTMYIAGITLFMFYFGIYNLKHGDSWGWLKKGQTSD